LPTALKWSLNYQPNSAMLSQFSFNNQLNYRFEKPAFGPGEQALGNALIWHSSIKYAASNSMDVTLSVINLTNGNYRASADEDAAWQPERSVSLKWQWFY